MEQILSQAELLEKLESLSEDHLRSQFIAPLLDAMGFTAVRITHGSTEFGKDIVFRDIDKFRVERWSAIQVKADKVTGDNQSSHSFVGLLNQLFQMMMIPFTNVDGEQKTISHGIFITSHRLNNSARDSIKQCVTQRGIPPITVLDGVELIALIREYAPHLLNTEAEQVTHYCKRLEENFRLHLDCQALGIPKAPVLDDFYVLVSILVAREAVYIRRNVDGVTFKHDFQQAFVNRVTDTAGRIQQLLQHGQAHGDLIRIEYPPRSHSSEAAAVTPRIEYSQLARLFASSLQEIENRKLDQRVIDANISDDDFVALLSTLRAFQVVHPISNLLPEMFRSEPAPGFQKLQLPNAADPQYLFSRVKRLWLVGNAGTGKSTSCRYHTLLLSRKMKLEDEATYVPIVVSLSTYSSDSHSLLEELVRVVGMYGLDCTRFQIAGLLNDGRCVVFLDGLDEVPADQRPKVLMHLNAFTDAFPNNSIVITSRFIGDPPELLEYTRFHTTLFDDNQIYTFCARWFVNDSEKAARMARDLGRNESIRAVARNPLTLTIMAALVGKGKPLPERRVDVYRDRLELLFEDWDAMRGVTNRNNFDQEVKLPILKKLGFSLHEHQKREFAYREFESCAQQTVPDMFNTPATILALFEELISVNSLIRKLGDDVYDFGHLSFQEYFAALEWSDNATNQKLYAKRFVQSWWRQVGLMAAGILRKADELVTYVMMLGDSVCPLEQRLDLAVGMIAEADHTSTKIVQNVVRRISEVRYGLLISNLLLSARHRVAYENFFSVVSHRSNVWMIHDLQIQEVFSDAMGARLYDTLLEWYSRLPREVAQAITSMMENRGTTLEQKYLERLRGMSPAK